MGVSLLSYKTFTPITDADEIARIKQAQDDGEYDENLARPYVYAGFEHGLEGLHAEHDAEYGGSLVYGPWGRTGDALRESEAQWSYSGYNDVRATLCRALLDVEPETVWENPEEYRDKPLFDLIHFADNEGTLGPVSSRRLADVLTSKENRERFIAWVSDHFGAEDHSPVVAYYIQAWDSLADVFEHAADTGMVRFC